MDLDHVDGRLKIQYSDRLVSLLREVRQLSALGFPIPAKIQQAANTADKFYRQAIVLKQVRVYYRSKHSHTNTFPVLIYLVFSLSIFLFFFVSCSYCNKMLLCCRWPISTTPLTNRWFPLRDLWCLALPWPLNRSSRYCTLEMIVFAFFALTLNIKNCFYDDNYFLRNLML